MKSPKEQKNAIANLLSEIFPNKTIYCNSLTYEMDFEWSNITPELLKDRVINNLYHKLESMRGYTDFAKNGKIKYDFCIIDTNLIIEYDEKQHFTKQRKEALQNYPEEIGLCFDKQQWINECDRVQAKDNDPIYRDEQRAFRDAIRDIQSYRKGFKLIRIKHGENDFCSQNGKTILERILSSYDVHF